MNDSETSILIDSSVLIKWFIHEEDSNEALKLRDAFLAGNVNLVMPELAIYEISNALRFSKLFLGEEVKRCVRALLTLDVEVLTFDFHFLEEAIDLSIDKQLAIYDAYFVACAKNNDLTFVTADTRALKKICEFEFAFSLASAIDYFDL